MVLNAQGIIGSLALVHEERSQQIHGSNGAERDLVYHIMRKHGFRRLTNALGNYFASAYQ
jgi:hypothetical protein